MEDLREAARYYLERASEEYKQRARRAMGGGESLEDFYVRETKRHIRRCDVCAKLLVGFCMCCTKCELYKGCNYSLCVKCFYGRTFQHDHDSFADNHSVLMMHNEGRGEPTCVIEKAKGNGKQCSNASSDCKSIRRNISGLTDSSDYKSIRPNIPSSTDSSDCKLICRNISCLTDSSDYKSIRPNISGSTDSSDCKSIRRKISGSTDSSDYNKSIRRNIPSSTDSSDYNKSIRRNIPSSTDSSDYNKSIRRNISSSTDSSDYNKSIRRNIPSSTDSRDYNKSIRLNIPSSTDSGDYNKSIRRNIPSSTNSSDYNKSIRRNIPSSTDSSDCKTIRCNIPGSTNSSHSKSIIPVPNLRDSSESNSIHHSVRKIMIDKEGIEKLAYIAQAHYNAAPEKIRNSADKFFWSMVKQKGETRVAMEDFLESMNEMRYPEYAHPELFKMVVKDRNVGMSITESRTVYYIVVSGRPFCSWCKCFIPDLYFCCSKCSARSYALCLHCYSNKAYVNHGHSKDDDVFFLDHSVLHTTINVTAPERSGCSKAIVERNPRDDKVATVVKVGQAILNAGAAVLSIASTLGACTIM